MRRTPRAPEARTLAAYLEGELSQSEAQAVEAAARGSAAVQRDLEGMQEIRAALGSVDEEALRGDLVPELRAAIAREHPRTERPLRRGPLRLALSLLAGGCLVLIAAVLITHRLREGEVRSKGGAIEEDAWVGLHVLRVRGAGQPLRVEGQLAASDALVFAYSNAGPRPYSHLAIFAVGDGGEVFWYYPPHERAGGDPSSQPIEAGADVELREAVRHALRPGPLALYAIFTRAPLRVRQVEDAVAALVRAGRWSARTPVRLSFERSAQKMLPLTVTR